MIKSNVILPVFSMHMETQNGWHAYLELVFEGKDNWYGIGIGICYLQKMETMLKKHTQKQNK